ncbi:MAG: hypothetical protein LBT02_00330 [Rickettsiales bacterium]|jgi:hypothetical protein|nr:hypothetical protein [Rickettsiales bacterium]
MELKIKDLTFKVFFNDIIEEKDINYVHISKEKVFTEKAKAIIKEKWADKEKTGAYDGDIYEIIDAKFENGKLNIYFDYTKYSYTLVNRNPDYLNEKCYVTNHIATQTIIKTKDNKFPIISTKLPHYKFVGGYWEKGCKTISENSFKEIEEETGLNTQLSNFKILGIATQNNSTAITTLVDCALTSNEVLEFIKNNKNNIKDLAESSGDFKFIDLSIGAIDDFLNSSDVKFGGMTTFGLHNAKRIIS